MKNWTEFFGSLTGDQLQAVALLRVIECTNGCIQHTFRDNHPKALTLEETRRAMKYSMSAMKELSFQIGNKKYTFTREVADGLRDARELYVRAFKQGDESATQEFFECSLACVEALGAERILTAGREIREHLLDYFPEHTVGWGEAYLIRLLPSEE